MANVSRRLVLCAAASALAHPSLVRAQPYPAKPVRLVVPFAAGGASDTFARVVGEALGPRIGQTFIIENRSGAGGTIAAQAVARSAPDGHTLLVGDIGTHGIATSLYPRLGYDAVKDFISISHSVALPLALVVTPDLPARGLKDLLDEARRRPGELHYASSGIGGISHLAVEMLKAQAGVDFVHVPYKGGAPALTDVMSGQVQMMMPSVSTSLSHVRSGKLRALAVSTSSRVALLPDVPTMHEAGVADYVVEPWVGVLAPAGTPAAVVALLQEQFVAVLNLAAVREKLLAQGFDVRAGDGQALARVVERDVERWAAIVKRSGATAQ